MNKLFNIAGKIVLGVCIYGVYRKTYDWGKEYIEQDIQEITTAVKRISKQIKNIES